jgi:sugar phosphate isomerase/epimerase
MPDIRVGLPRVPSRESPELAVADVLAAGFTACEIDLAGGFWLDKEFAAGLGAAATDQGVTLTVHAPIPAFLGHVDRGAKLKRALGMLDHSAGLAILAGASFIRGSSSSETGTRRSTRSSSNSPNYGSVCSARDETSHSASR